MIDPNAPQPSIRTKVALTLARLIGRGAEVSPPPVETSQSAEPAAPPFWYLTDEATRQQAISASVEVAAERQLSLPDPLADHAAEFKSTDPKDIT